MKGDFTRDTFRPQRHFSRVLLQQGRTLLDADFNEQSAIVLHYLRALAADLIGPHGTAESGFLIITKDYVPDDGDPSYKQRIKELQKGLQAGDFYIFAGHYYVDGILCENDQDILFTNQPHPDHEPLIAGSNYLIYLDVWEQHISPDEDASIREVALGGPDTASRAQVVWRVRAKVLETTPGLVYKTNYDEFLKAIKSSPGTAPVTGRLIAKTKTREDNAVATEPCTLQPDARYRGLENQLYRVEIHRGGSAKELSQGTARNGTGTPEARKPATVKWSRDNGSCVFPISCHKDGTPQVEITYSQTSAKATVTLEFAWRGDHVHLSKGDWVELVDDNYALAEEPEPLWQVTNIVASGSEAQPVVSLTRNSGQKTSTGQSVGKHPLLRLWDHKKLSDGSGVVFDDDDGTLVVVEGTEIELEHGVWISFPSEKGVEYRSGDYWLIPARTQTNDVEWPGETDNSGVPKRDEEGRVVPMAIPPYRVEHHYAPLAVWVAGPTPSLVDCRRVIKPSWE